MTLSDPVLAILTADIHLSHRPPACRAGEKSWYAAMGRPLREIRDLQASHGGCAVVCAGDVFDRWNSPPELVNWAIDNLPVLHSVPGNHDTPHHSPELLRRSAYGTLVRAGRVVELGGWPVLVGDRLAIYGRPFGEPYPPTRQGLAGDSVAHLRRRGEWTRGVRRLHVLATHQYVWVPGAGHPASHRRDLARKVGRAYQSFDVVASGDNHHPFEVPTGRGLLWNCGGLLRRAADERDHRPRVGLLHSSGTVTEHLLDCSADVFGVQGGSDNREGSGVGAATALARSLSSVGVSSLDYGEALRRAAEGEDAGPRRALEAVIEEQEK